VGILKDDYFDCSLKYEGLEAYDISIRCFLPIEWKENGSSIVPTYVKLSRRKFAEILHLFRSSSLPMIVVL